MLVIHIFYVIMKTILLCLSYLLIPVITLAQSPPDTGAEPNYGDISLKSGFMPDPWEISLMAGGAFDLSNLDNSYSGFVSKAPDVNLNFTGESESLGFEVTSNEDTVLLINMPGGVWTFSDDVNGVNPLINLTTPEPGLYNIWVGTYDDNNLTSATLSVTELNDSDPQMSDTPDIAADPNFGDIELISGFSPDPYTREVVAGGSFNLSGMGYSGYISDAPDFDFYFTPGESFSSITITVESEEDTILLINTPKMEWLYNDDSTGMNPSITISNPSDGLFNIWIGTYNTETANATLSISEL